MRFIDDQDFVQTFVANHPHPALRIGVGIRRLRRCTKDMNAWLNLVSRSWIRKRKCGRVSDSVQLICRACWQTQAESDCVVQPAMWTRRLPSSMKNKTYTVCKNSVSTVKKIAGENLVFVMSHQLPPTRLRNAFWRRGNTVPIEDIGDGLLGET